MTAATAGCWERLLGGEGGDVLDLQFGERDDIVAVTRLGLFRLEDSGERWTRIESPPLVQTLHRADGWWLGTDIGLSRADRLDGRWRSLLSGVAVTCIAVAEQRDLVLAATVEDGLMRSEDLGITWEDANPGLPGDDIIAIHLSPAFAEDQTIFVATASGLFRSRNGGRAWREVPFDADDIQDVAIVGNSLMIGTGDDGLWVSADAGRTWDQSLPEEAVFGFGTSRDGHVLVLCESGLVTVDASGGIVDRSSIPPDAVCAIRVGGRTLVGTIGRGVFRLEQGEGEWTGSSLGLEATARDRVLVAGDLGIVTTSSAGAIVHLADGGASWSALSGALIESVSDIDVRFDADNGLEIIACDGQIAAVYRGDWTRLEVELPVAVAWRDREPAMLTQDGHFVCGEVRSRLLPGRLSVIGARLLAVRDHPNLLWAVLYTDSAGVVVLRSADGGRRWETLLQTDTTSAISLSVTVDSSGGDMALLAVGNRVFRVLESPEPVWTGDEALAISAIACGPDDDILLATSHGLFVTTRNFATVDHIAGSPAPLLDVVIAETGGAIMVERGGAIWRWRRTNGLCPTV